MSTLPVCPTQAPVTFTPRPPLAPKPSPRSAPAPVVSPPCGPTPSPASLAETEETIAQTTPLAPLALEGGGRVSPLCSQSQGTGSMESLCGGGSVTTGIVSSVSSDLSSLVPVVVAPPKPFFTRRRGRSLPPPPPARMPGGPIVIATAPPIPPSDPSPRRSSAQLSFRLPSTKSIPTEALFNPGVSQVFPEASDLPVPVLKGCFPRKSSLASVEKPKMPLTRGALRLLADSCYGREPSDQSSCPIWRRIPNLDQRLAGKTPPPLFSPSSSLPATSAHPQFVPDALIGRLTEWLDRGQTQTPLSAIPVIKPVPRSPNSSGSGKSGFRILQMLRSLSSTGSTSNTNTVEDSIQASASAPALASLVAPRTQVQTNLGVSFDDANSSNAISPSPTSDSLGVGAIATLPRRRHRSTSPIPARASARLPMEALKMFPNIPDLSFKYS